jgi:membrane protease YdiL (CAAX protease family)
VIWALALTAVVVFLLGPLMGSLPGWLGLNGGGNTLAEFAKLPVWYLTLAAVVGGTIEEILYRGFAIEHLSG